MFFFLSKVLNFFIQPAVWIFVLMICALILKKKRILFLSLATALFFLLTNGFIFNEVVSRWEPKPVELNKLAKYDYVVVLGGFSNFDTVNKRLKLNEAGDRIWQALQLYESGKASKILITGGSGSLLHQDETEADKVKSFLLSMKVPEKDITMEMTSRNTHENATNTNEWIEKHSPKAKCLLVTSAWHMPRSLGCFKKVGMNVTAYPVNHFSESRKFDYTLFIVPSTYALNGWGMLLKEWVGYATYKVVGYL
jgi:uncharacterized SAM-binding protein YcdF (DUF218 family)